VIEVLVDTSLAECESRDPKGLYAEARSKTETALPGIGVPYEPPATPEVTAHGGLDHAAADRVTALLRG
jgi:bifunctional enzyme CysN/CysC